MEISERIKEIRKKKGFSQKQLAQKAGLSIAAIQGYEQGKYKPKQETVNRIADALGVEAYELDISFFERNMLIKAMRTLAEKLGSLHAAIELATTDHEKNRLMAESQMVEEELSQLSLREKEINSKVFIWGENVEKISSALRELNDQGQQEAVRQVELLTKIPDYRKDTPD